MVGEAGTSMRRGCFALMVGVRLLCLAALIAGGFGCVSYRGAPLEPEQSVEQMEALLAAAGFKQIVADSPQKMAILSKLPPHQLRYYPTKNGLVFWYADPDKCRCVYQGDQKAYQQFQLLKLQQREIEEYEQAAMAEQGSMLYAFDPLWFGMPFFLPPAYIMTVPGAPAGKGPGTSPATAPRPPAPPRVVVPRPMR